MDQHLHPATSSLAFDWFLNVGRGELPPDAIAVGSWDSAIKKLVSIEWQDYRLDAQNYISESLVINGLDDLYSGWKTVVDDANMIISDRLPHILSDVFPHTPGRESCEIAVILSAIRMTCVEICYESYVDSEVFRSIYSWLERGRLPCGVSTTIDGTRLEIF